MLKISLLALGWWRMASRPAAGVVDVREAAALVAPVDQEHGAAGEQRRHELGEHPGPALVAGGYQIVEPGADEVERPDDAELDLVLERVGMDHPLQQLLAGGVDPPLLGDRAADQLGLVLLVGVARGAAVHLAGGVLDDPFAVFDAEFDDLEVLQEVQLEGVERGLHVDGGVGVCDEVDDHITRHQFVLYPRIGEVRLDEAETVTPDARQLLVIDVDADDLVVRNVRTRRDGQPDSTR